MIEQQSMSNAVRDSSGTQSWVTATTQVASSPHHNSKNAESASVASQDKMTTGEYSPFGPSVSQQNNKINENRSAPIVASLGVAQEQSATTASADALLKAPSAWQKIIWKLMPFTTVGRALNSARERLHEAGCSSASLDAQVILAYVLGVDRSWLFAHHEYKLNAEQADAYTDLIGRRMAHEPVAYLVGKREFYGLEFLVDQRVLIPRPETELLVDAVLDIASDREGERIVVADVGTGSGAIALSVAHNCPNAHIYAIDLSDDALEVAHSNVERIDERGQVTLAHGDLLTPLPERVHIIVANLPYISSEIYPDLDVDVRDFEPQLALEAGPEGLDAIQRLLRQAAHYLLPDGVILLEIGYDQGGAVTDLAKVIFPQAQGITVRKDYHGHDRLVTIIP
ncbi:MAG TPA: peptide chain release factor N(5)-glutamine methyltransferase [Caldilineaceae bacterium]|nr:peptide chain release factor N(5)-glutamine methyltransferase [Caldilineaceae bacterium]